MFFQDRKEAGIKLVEVISKSSMITEQWDVVGIVRGGVVIAHEIARNLNVKAKAICIDEMILDETSVLIASSIGSGMIFDTKATHFLPDLAHSDVPDICEFAQLTHSRYIEFTGRDTVYGNNVLICDDGVVSGKTLVTAVQCFRHYGVKNIAAAIPVVTPRIIEQSNFPVFTWRITKMKNPTTGAFYVNFDDVEDAEVMSLL